MDVYAQIAESIIEHQEAIIGPVAVEQAERVAHLHIAWDKHEVSIDSDPAIVVDNLVRTYEHLFGRISVEVSKDAAAAFLAQLQPNGWPQTLK